jgi:hypothetical protein
MSENKTNPAKPEAKISQSDIEAGITPHVDAIIKIQSDRGDSPKWDKSAHVSLIARIAVDCGLPEDAKNDFVQFMAEAGVGGNQSQFLQSKYLKDKLPKHSTRKQLVEAY